MIFKNFIIKMYKGMAYSRCDDNGTAYYFSSDDFKGLNKESYPFYSKKGNKLQGYLYYYDGYIKDRIVVFDHGFGGGHRSYMKEIELLCKEGYLVFAYDHTGCMESGGENTNGMATSLVDLNDCITMIKNNERFKGLDISVIGHSWGGFSTMNITSLHPEISKVVVISGFISVPLLVDSFFKGLLKGYRKHILEIENQSNPDFMKYNGIKTLSETKAKVLLVYSDNDHLCKKEETYDKLYAALNNKENIEFMLVNNKGHNPNYTEDAVKYLNEYVSIKTKLMKKKKLKTKEQQEKFVSSYDWDRMTKQDELVWNKIFSHLK